MDPSVSYLEATNIAFMGCNVVEGEGRGIVVAVGANNQVNYIYCLHLSVLYD